MRHLGTGGSLQGSIHWVLGACKNCTQASFMDISKVRKVYCLVGNEMPAVSIHAIISK